VKRVEALPCKASFGAIVFLVFVCGPFAAWGAKGEEEYP
jgi:hypothetical protein